MAISQPDVIGLQQLSFIWYDTAIMKRIILRILLPLSAIEGFIALLFIFWIPSMEKNATLLGYSPLRIIFGVVIFVPLMLFIWATNKIYREDDAITKIDAWLAQRMVEEKLFIPTIVYLFFGFVFGAVCLYLFFAPVSQHLGMLVAVLARMMSLVVWILLLAIQGLVLLLVGYFYAYRYKWGKGFDIRLVFNACLAPVMILTAIAHWAVYYFRLELFINIPEWFWKFQQKAWTWRDGLFVLLLAIAVIIMWMVLNHPTKLWRNLSLLIGIGVAIQICFGFIDEGGLDAIRQKYILTDHSAYARQAVNEPNLLKTLTDYERMYGNDYYLGTKPPGLMAIYILTEKISNSIQPAYTNYETYMQLTWFITYVFPWIAMLAIIMLFFLSRRFYDQEGAWMPAILYISCASVILMPLFMDQVLYPLLFTCSMLMAMKAVESNSLKWALAGGAVIFISLYVSFSLIPILGMVIGWLGIRLVLPFFSDGKVEKVPLATILKVLLGLIAGWIAIMVFWQYVFNYDFITRYATAMAQHRNIRHFYPGFRQIIDAFILNNSEFAVWAGFPLTVLFLWRLVKMITAFTRREAGKSDGMMAAFFGTYVALNLFGQTKGEVGRLWIFLLPMIALFAASELRSVFGYLSTTPLFKSENRERAWEMIALMLVFTLQLISALVIFHCQDLNGLYFTE